jgi:hypothetical protein
VGLPVAPLERAAWMPQIIVARGVLALPEKLLVAMKLVLPKNVLTENVRQANAIQIRQFAV